jgi:streptogramin lyase
VLWSKQVQDPLAAQRLPNGNTFIATRFQLIEVDRNGKQVFSYLRPQGDLIMKAQKRPNGEIGFVTDAGLFVRIDPAGKEVGQFRVDLRTSGGRIDLLPNGRVLVPLKDQNKVVEYDSQGKIVWEVSFPDPVNAVRLPNGHTMITSFQATRAAEVDAEGKTVYEYKSDIRVTRAWRR